MTDIIYLNLEKWDTQKISFEEAQKVMEQSGMTMDQLAKSPLFLKGAHQHYIDRHSGQGLENLPSSLMGDGPVENSINDQGLKNLPSSKSVDNSPKTQGLENLPSPTKVGLTGDQGRFDSSEGGPRFKRNARAQINLKIKDSSISQSVNSSGPVENSESTDRWMKIENSKNPQTKPTQGGKSENPVKSPQVAQGDSEASFVGKSSPTAVLGSQQGVQGSVGSEAGQVGPAGAVGVVAARGSEAAERVHRGVDLERVKATLHHAGIPAMSVPAAMFVRMIDLVLGRATAPVQSPNGYVTAAMKNGWGELLSKAQSQPGNEAGASSAAVCRQHRFRLSPAGECKRCIAEQRAAELDEVQHELTWKRHLNQIDVAALEVSLRRAGCSVDALPVPVFGQCIMDALEGGVSATTQGLYEFFKNNHQEIFKIPVSGSAGIWV